MFRECVNVYTVCMYITYMFRECVNVYHDHVHVYCMSKLTIFKSVLDNVVRHATGSHGHVGHNVKGVVPGRLQVINNIASGVIANDNLVFFIIQTWVEKRDSVVKTHRMQLPITTASTIRSRARSSSPKYKSESQEVT